MSKDSKVPKMRKGSIYYDDEFSDDNKFIRDKKKNRKQFRRDRQLS